MLENIIVMIDESNYENLEVTHQLSYATCECIIISENILLIIYFYIR